MPTEEEFEYTVRRLLVAELRNKELEKAINGLLDNISDEYDDCECELCTAIKHAKEARK